MKLKVYQGHSGFSLLEILVGLAATTIVSMTSLFLVGQTKQTEITGEVSYSLIQSHILALQKSKSTASMKAAIGLTSGSALSDCLSGRGIDCASLASTAWKPIPGFNTSTQEPGGQTVSTTGDYKFVCGSPASCEALIIRIQSALYKGPSLMAQKNSEVRLAGILLGDRRKMDFSCASSGHLLTALNMGTLTGECLPLPSTGSCSGPIPLKQYLIGAPPACAAATTLSCGTGFRKIGILDGQKECL
jgi:hypothetical protein